MLAPREYQKPSIVATKRPLTRRQPLGVISNQTHLFKPEPQKAQELKPHLKPVSKTSVPTAKLGALESTLNLLSVAEKKDDKVEVSEEVKVEPTPSISVKDVDEKDSDNPQLVSAYVKDIYNYLRSLETQFPIREDFLQGRSVNGRMRSIILDWLLQVCLKFELLPETFYLTVDIFDRYIQIPEQFVHKGNLQLIGVTALFIATKYEEMYSPSIGDYVYITDKSCTEKDIRLMEIKMLKSLDFFLGKPTPIQFLRRNSKSGEVDVVVHTMAKFMIELSIMEYTMAHVNPSALAAAALCLSLLILRGAEWTDVLSHYSYYSASDLTPIMNSMAKIFQKSETSKLKTVRAKYESSKLLQISLRPELKSETMNQMAALAI